MATDIENAGHFEEVINSDKIVVIDFWAEWCGPCRMLAQVIDNISRNRDDIVVYKLNVDSLREISAKYEILSIPTIMVFRRGEILDSKTGFVPESTFNSWIDGLLDIAEAS
jgi:thioredoxin 1